MYIYICTNIYRYVYTVPWLIQLNTNVQSSLVNGNIRYKKTHGIQNDYIGFSLFSELQRNLNFHTLFFFNFILHSFIISKKDFLLMGSFTMIGRESIYYSPDHFPQSQFTKNEKKKLYFCQNKIPKIVGVHWIRLSSHYFNFLVTILTIIIVKIKKRYLIFLFGHKLYNLMTDILLLNIL